MNNQILFLTDTEVEFQSQSVGRFSVRWDPLPGSLWRLLAVTSVVEGESISGVSYEDTEPSQESSVLMVW